MNSISALFAIAMITTLSVVPAQLSHQATSLTQQAQSAISSILQN
jgi:Flp pilus assembly pilin Flp